MLKLLAKLHYFICRASTFAWWLWDPSVVMERIAVNPTKTIARKIGIPDRIVTFQVMRRTFGTDMQQHGTLKDTQSLLRHASIRTTYDVYVQTIEQSVVAAVNSRTSAVLGRLARAG